jgi:hypothetical protein
MGRAYSMHGKEDNCIQNCGRKTEGPLARHWRRWGYYNGSQRNRMRRYALGSCGSCSCAHGNEPSGSIKIVGNF